MARVDTYIERLTASRACLWLPLLYFVPTLFGPFILDDYYMIRRIERYRAGEIAEPRLFRFAETAADRRELRDRTTWPWWLDGTGTTAFFRPLTEVSLLFDEQLYHRHAFGYRLGNFLWFMLALLLVRRLFQVAGGSTVEVEMATVAFGAAQSVAAPVAFISARGDLMVVVGVALASIMAWKAVQVARLRVPVGTIAAVLISFVFALCSKEAALPLVGVWCAFAWVERRIAKRDHAAPDQWRIITWVAVAVGFAAAIYVGVYVTYGYGTHVPGRSMSDAFTDAFGHAAWTAGLLLPLWTLGIPSVIWIIADRPLIAWALLPPALAVLVVIVRHLVRHWRTSATSRFFILWTVMFSMPALLATPEPRVLCAATVGWSFLMARLVCARGDPARTLPRADRPMSDWWRLWLYIANGNLAVIIGLSTVWFGQWTEWKTAESLRGYVTALPRPLRDGDTLIITKPEHSQETFAAADRLEMLTGHKNLRLHFLVASPSAAVSRRVVDDHTIDVETDATDLLGRAMLPIVGSFGDAARISTRYETADFTADTTRASNDRVHIRFHFRESLTGDNLLFLPPLTESK